MGLFFIFSQCEPSPFLIFLFWFRQAKYRSPRIGLLRLSKWIPSSSTLGSFWLGTFSRYGRLDIVQVGPNDTHPVFRSRIFAWLRCCATRHFGYELREEFVLPSSLEWSRSDLGDGLTASNKSMLWSCFFGTQLVATTNLRIPLEGDFSWLLKSSALTDSNDYTMFMARSCSCFWCNMAVQIMILSHVQNALRKSPATHGNRVNYDQSY